MTGPHTSRAGWRKSTYSNNGGNCIEVTTLDDDRWRTSTRSGNGGACVQVVALSDAAWRKSARSNNGGNCVEVTALDDDAWHTSTRSGNGGECVQIADAGPVIAVRDSKDPRGPHLDFAPRAWHAFVTTLKTAT